MGASEAALLEALPAALLSKKDDSVISQGLSLLNDDLTFAEDLILVSFYSSFVFCGDALDGLFHFLHHRLLSTKKK